MKCKNCNNEIEDFSKFCKYCGVKVENVGEENKQNFVFNDEKGNGSQLINEDKEEGSQLTNKDKEEGRQLTNKDKEEVGQLTNKDKEEGSQLTNKDKEEGGQLINEDKEESRQLTNKDKEEGSQLTNKDKEDGNQLSNKAKEEISDTIINNNSIDEKRGTKFKKKFSVKVTLIILAIILVVLGGSFYAYSVYLSRTVAVSVNDRDYKTVNNEFLAFNYSGNLYTGELYLVKNSEGTKIADNVVVNRYYMNPVKAFVFYSVAVGDNNKKNYIYENGVSKEFTGEFYKYTEDGLYMLYVNDSNVYMYDCNNGATKKIAPAIEDMSACKYKYDDKNKVVYLCLGDNNRLYKATIDANADVISVSSNVDSFNIFGDNSYGYKKIDSNNYNLKTKNTEEAININFTDIKDIQASQDGETIIFTATKDDDEDKEYALYVMVEGIEEPIRLLSGPVYKFEYKEECNKVFAFKEDSLYSINLIERTVKNKKDKDIYYTSLSECEAVKLESDVSDFMASPDGKSLIAVKGKAEQSEKNTEATTYEENTTAKQSDGFMNVVYAAEVETNSLNTDTATSSAESSEEKNSSTEITSDNAEMETESTTSERVIGSTMEVCILRGENKKYIEVTDSVDLCRQYLSISNNSIVYPLAVNGKVELHIIDNINDELDNIDKNDEILCSNAGLFNYDNIYEEMIFFDKDALNSVSYSRSKKGSSKKSLAYDLIYINAGKGFDNYNLAYKKIPEYSDFVGKFKIESSDDSFNSIIIEFTDNKSMNVYSTGNLRESCVFGVDTNSSNRTSLRISPIKGGDFVPNCMPYYNHSDYSNSLLTKTMMSKNSLLISDFDGVIKYKISDSETVNIIKLTDEEFNEAIEKQKATHNQNVTQLQNEKVAAEAAAAEAARREELDNMAMNYYIYGVYVYSSETFYYNHGYDCSTGDSYIYSHYADVYDYYVDYESGDIWLKTIASDGTSLWVVR